MIGPTMPKNAPVSAAPRTMVGTFGPYPEMSCDPASRRAASAPTARKPKWRATLADMTDARALLRPAAAEAMPGTASAPPGRCSRRGRTTAGWERVVGERERRGPPEKTGQGRRRPGRGLAEHREGWPAARLALSGGGLLDYGEDGNRGSRQQSTAGPEDGPHPENGCGEASHK